ncbi:PAS domain-containing protein [Kordiimonas marina]|uniref:PAS domain-containing protein n=1 Tax=Kordiimonas marina TaxID=2872312 RepID=UPI001FF6B9BA|nr:PAS domain-containing protein [Kordiimonas marina]MCJ9428672.1 PAS domain-containing protein [Kordiimonas marina]
MLHQQQFDELRSYWRELQRQNDGRVPRRRQFNPMRVPRLLPYIMLIERRGEYDLHVRLAGTALEAAAGRSLTGQCYLEFYDESQWGFFADMTAAMCDQPCGCRLDREVTFLSGRTMEMHSFNLPFSTEEGEVRYLLGVMAMRRSVHHYGTADDNKIKSFMVRDFEFIDLGYGVPVDEQVKAQLAKIPA